MVRLIRLIVTVAVVAAATAARADVILDWNNVWLDSVRDIGGPPVPVSRCGAMVHVAMYDAVNSIDHAWQPYMKYFDCDAGASQEASAASAAYHTLCHLHPTLQSTFDAAFAASLAGIADAGKADGVALGQAVANELWQRRLSDGADAASTYTPTGLPGHWQPTPPDYTPAFNPEWGNVTTWALPSASQVPVPTPPTLTSAAYATAYNEVKELGAIDSTSRSAEQTQIAAFWANDRDGTSKPEGQMNQIAQAVSIDKGLSLGENARMLALLNVALADAGIVAWKSKYAYDLWRPITGIRLGDDDGNPDTIADANWQPLSNDPVYNGFTPPFPAYASGHATFSAAAAAVLARLFGDETTFCIGTDETGYSGPPLRQYDSFTDMAYENGRSRVYLGVHWQFDADAGFDAGWAVGNYAMDHVMLPEPAALLTLSAGALLCLRRRMRSRS